MAVNRDVPVIISPDAPDSQKWAFVNQNFKTIADNINPLIVSDGSNNRVLLGKRSDGSYGLFVSPAGTDVDTATNAQLVFNSGQDIFKIVSKITGAISGTNNSGSGLWATGENTHAHGQSFTPAILPIATGTGLFLSGRRRTMPTPVNFNSALGFPWQEWVEAYVDATNVYVRYYTAGSTDSSGRSVSYTVYVLQETAT